MDLYLHIGTEKTGTTAIQRFFKTNREALAERDICYPTAPGNENHLALARAALLFDKRGALRRTAQIRTDDDVHNFRKTLLADLSAELTARPYRFAVMSNEHCSSHLLDDEEVVWLKDALAPLFDRIRIVVYLRRQDDYLLSSYSTAVKSGVTHTLAIPRERAIHVHYDHWDLLSRWARVFGRDNIIARRFEKTSLKSGDVVDDFLDCTGIEASSSFQRPDTANESLDAESLEFLRLFNEHIPRLTDDGISPLRDNVVPLLSKISKGPLLTLPEAELADFMALFRDSNAKVAAEYFGGVPSGGDDPLFAPRNDTRPRVTGVTLSVERTVEICAWLWQNKQAQVDRVTERLKKKRGELERRRNRRNRLGGKPAQRRDAAE